MSQPTTLLPPKKMSQVLKQPLTVKKMMAPLDDGEQPNGEIDAKGE